MQNVAFFNIRALLAFFFQTDYVWDQFAKRLFLSGLSDNFKTFGFFEEKSFMTNFQVGPYLCDLHGVYPVKISLQFTTYEKNFT